MAAQLVQGPAAQALLALQRLQGAVLKELPQAQQLGLGQGPAPSATLTALQQTVKRILK